MPQGLRRHGPGHEVAQLGQALRAPTYTLWDEAKARMVRFRDVRG